MRVENSTSTYPVRVVIVMGVSGSGKTTIGSLLAQALNNAPFIDADSLHPPHNVQKMAHGIALTDGDRWPWLMRVRSQLDIEATNLLKTQDSHTQPLYVVCGCSALKRSYRELLARNNAEHSTGQTHDTMFVYIKVDREELARRLAQRKDHFFDPALLDTQLSTLEQPDTAREAAVVVDGMQPVEQVVREACELI
ncbi:hypothetical protein LPJ77_002288 [Coemansia sp. RSA 2523]|nr:hypothetical protein LPJ69_000928 [Coemansia sp. RSA 1752]KAJ1778310.1 hypothetical protein LPJ54_001787 [Coemansia sp. RSA 1824]KAJ1787358.1 hypothetical protein LPJ62_003397 [Coemansia sp. RSA 2167]KAJ1808521.1 hypothetical protein LPJ77_002288 [Coemansia sp. RSA 2523]KAJ2135950.1 hypothetical protein J3F82_006447 [Coemansia sp. RSA 637]KAJ2527135.1 hypothetical protein GGH20_003201 [Coemansia sp. RSA 1937]KAJ2576989.1 hypothetical protein GGH19_001720 [Coemansia sp. RSA 1807]KAJ2594134